MAEVITQCDCGQLPALEPAEIPPAFIDYADDDGTRWNEPRAEYQARRAAECEACGAGPGEECRPMCIGQAAELDRLGVDLTEPEAHEFSAEPDDIYPHLVRGHCSCGWHSSGYSRIARVFFDRHVAETGGA